MASAVADYCKIVRQRVNCDGWTTGTNDIVCTINDEKGVHSATYMLRHMQIEAARHSLMLAGAQIGSLKLSWVGETHGSDDQAVMCLISFGILLMIIGPFLCYKHYIDETYNITSSREKKRTQNMIDRDKRERARAKRNML